MKGRDKPITPYALKAGKRITLDDREDDASNMGALIIRSVCKVPLMDGLERLAKLKKPVDLRYILIEGNIIRTKANLTVSYLNQLDFRIVLNEGSVV